MYLKTGDNLLKVGTNVLQNGENLILKLVGPRFPLTVSVTSVAIMQLQFSQSTYVTINYGNGVVISYPTYYQSAGVYTFALYDKGSSNVTSMNPNWTTAYIYPDGLTTASRVVSINFNRSLLRYFSISLTWLSNQDFVFGFSRFPNLNSFNIQQLGLNQNGCFGNMDLSNIASLTSINSVSINSAFNSSSPYKGTIPLFLLNMPLVSLSVGDGNFTSTSLFTVNNLANIYLTAATLKTLFLQGMNLNDSNSGQGALPSNFSLLTNLQSFTMTSSLHTQIPSVINSITSLVNISFGYSTYLTSFGNISALTNLVGIVVTSAGVDNFSSASLPSYFSGFTKLKGLTLNGLYMSSTIDTMISSIYSLVTTYSTITGTSATPFRSMTINIGQYIASDSTAIPSGTYQQPSGYVQGSSNGTPASSLEMIWVMVHQYAHSWTYRTV